MNLLIAYVRNMYIQTKSGEIIYYALMYVIVGNRYSNH